MPTKNKLFKTKVFHENRFLFFQKQAIIINQECGMALGLAKVEFPSEKFNVHFISRTIPMKDSNFFIKFMMLPKYLPPFGLGSNSGLLS